MRQGVRQVPYRYSVHPTIRSREGSVMIAPEPSAYHPPLDGWNPEFFFFFFFFFFFIDFPELYHTNHIYCIIRRGTYTYSHTIQYLPTCTLNHPCPSLLPCRAVLHAVTAPGQGRVGSYTTTTGPSELAATQTSHPGQICAP
ncbi:hypothetical protein LY76DRAFT_24738 [Colletotrichum caudatum]|nr:hypothetical protein LY76DRAFT_24738 [Colletotrichum caudatum]